MDDPHHDHAQDLPMAGATAGSAIDPVCGMTVDPDAALANGLTSQFQGADYFFCSKGCKLDFDEDPEHYLDPGYIATM
jgi:YHS domain-containing protein